MFIESLRRNGCLLSLAIMLFLSGVSLCRADQVSPVSGEYALKAVYLYNFAHFSHWPTERCPKKNPPIKIIVVGQSPFSQAIAELEVKLKEDNKEISVTYYSSYREALALDDCHLLFICSSERKKMKKIIADLQGAPVLTVADSEGFLEAGGMIGLVLHDNKLRWEINRDSLWSAGLRVDAKLLQMALRIKNDQHYKGLPRSDSDGEDYWPLEMNVFATYPD